MKTARRAQPDVVVSGMGLITPIGSGEGFWQNLLAGKSGFSEVTSFDTSRFRVHVGAEVRDFRPADHVRRQDPSELGRASQLAVGAARQALEDADLRLSDFDPRRLGVCIGTTSGEPQIIERLDDDVLANRLGNADPGFIHRYPCHVLAGHIAREFGLCGLNLVTPNACAAGNYAVACALDALRAGRADVVLAGGADAFSRITYTGFARLGAIARDVCRPFDSNRTGMIPGEGAAVLVMERREQAVRRGARMYAEVVGYGLSCDAFHMTGPQPDGQGAANAMHAALRHARVGTAEIGYISAHGTGTKASDVAETNAVKRVFGEQAYAIPMSSIKSMLGHTMGAASAIEAATCALAVANDRIPPTANWQTADPECDLDYVTEGSRELAVGIAMNNANAFGGNNASVIFRKP